MRFRSTVWMQRTQRLRQKKTCASRSGANYGGRFRGRQYCPSERLSEKISEQSEVIEVTETASQDQNLQHTVERTLLDFVEADKIVPPELVSERRSEQSEGVEAPKN